ncbi:FIG00003370: Multicopper polyphenol oxidase [hydrothermal vent metagenome]|uniref:FIG00003370: Multicopper polyphenol oxidase n=1 Tax=hydrothermal vent metagenome TaxID=652676 RepID=A0A3B0Y939_9ZZZZ
MIYPRWPAPAAVHAVSTTRAGGVSQPPYDGLNLASHVGDRKDAVQANRAQLVKQLNLAAEPAWLEQVHGDTVVDAAITVGMPSADASYARQAGVACAVMTADCLPVLFCDPRGEVVAAAHAGWRGLAAGVLEAVVTAMAAPPESLLVWLGPAIGADVFEVGEEVRSAFVDRQAEAAAAFHRSDNDRWLADIYWLARLRLVSVGVERIYGGGFCTYSDNERFFSFRRQATTGRMASLIWIGH